MTVMTPAAVFVLSTFAIFFPDSITGCGGELKDKTGTITSPIYPANYPNNAVCNWTIVAAVGEIIDLRFSKLDLDGYSDSCPDVVTVFDGDGPSTAAITRLCRMKTQTELQGLFIRSTGNKMHITFTSDGFNTRQGFLATYWTQACPQWKYGRDLCNATCSCVVNNSWACSNFNGDCTCKQGWTGSDCSMDINECTASRTEICPSYQNCVNAPGSFSCQCSEGLVKNVTTGECQVNPTLRCNVNGCSHLCVQLPANNSPICYCPDDTTLIGNTCQACPTLKYGKNCSKTCNCNSVNGRCNPQTGGCICNTGWTSADCSRDVNECADTSISSICTRRGMSCVNTPGSYECVCGKGFEPATNQSCVPINCKNVINQATSGIIQSPYYPDTYWPNANCSWTIRSTATNKISLRVNNLPNECASYYYDYVDVYDGEDTTAPWLGRYCQRKPPLGTIRSTGNTMHITFISDGSVQESFLDGTYLAYDYPSCKQTWALNQTQKLIQSPGYPGYRNNTFCYWIITGTTGTTISLRVKNLNIDSLGQTFLAVYDGRRAGDSLLGKYFGTSMPPLIRSSGLSMYIVFQSEGSVDGTGFNGTVHAQNCPAFYYGQEECNIPCQCVQANTRSCDNIYGTCSCRPGWRSSDCSVDIDECSENPSICTKTEKCINTPGGYYCQPDCNKDFSGNGIIETKDYPNIPLNRARCNFTIMGSPGTVVTLMIASEDFDLKESASCTIDNLEVYSSQIVIANQLIGKYCGTRLPHIIRSTERAMLLKLATYNDTYSSRRGFRGQFYTHPCPDFRYGTTCQFLCTCHQSRTQFCDNTNGLCVCKTGWMGEDCSEDVNECRFPRCAVNEACQNLPGSFNCSCKNGFAKNASGLCVSSRTNCTTKIKDACSHSCYFDSITRKDTCSCPDGLELGSTPNTKYNCVIPYYPYGQSAGDLNLSSSSDKAGHSYRSNAIVFTSPVPFGTSLKTEAYVFSNGLIGFDKIEVSEEPDLQAANGQKIDLISAFWSKIDSAKGQVSYHLYEKCDPSDFNEAGSTANSPHKTQVFERAAADVKQKTGLYDFDVNMVLVVTWQDLRPLVQTNIEESNTFQAVYVSGNAQEKITDQGFSDVETAYVYFIYQKGQMRWQYKIGRKTEIGYVAKPYATTNSVQITDKSFSLNEANYLESIMLEVARHTSPVQKCKNHVCKNSRLITNFAYRSEIQELYNCPCTVGQLGLQWMFFENRGQDIYCYAISAVAKRRLLPSNPRNKLCCYKWRQPPSGSTWETWAESIAVSSFIHNTADAGHVLVGDREWFKGVQENLDAHQWCCKDSQDSKMCSRFNSIYPDLQCTYDVTFVPAYLLGDPHIVTFDNKTYTMNGLAEYILMDVQSVNFTLQARTGKVKTNKGVFTNATVFTAFAAKEGNARFQVELSVDKKTMLIYVDGINYTADFYKNASFRLTKEEIDISRDNHFNKTKVSALFPSNVIVQVNVGVDCLELNLEVDKALRGKTRGLLGNFNGRADDEFLLPNGTVLPANMTEEQIYKNFAIALNVKGFVGGFSDQVTSSTTVFTYSNGMTTANYTEPGYTPIFRSSLNPSAALLKNATDFCGVGQELCVYDYLVTGDTRFAQNTKTTQALSIASRKTLENNVPNITIDESSSKFTNQRWFVQEGVVNTLRFTATDKDGDLLIYLLDGSPRGASINQSGVLTYTPNSLEPVSINVRVKDTKNGYSPIIYLPVLICPRCNNRGICDLNSTRKIEYFDGLVQILKCACSPAYLGDSCESEKDACKSKPCARGQNCTDLTAAQQGNSSIGHVCGPCPAGFEDFKGRCVDKDECNGTQVCEQICTNTEGSYLCSCNDGFIVSGLNPRTCLVKNCSNRCLPENTLYCNESISKCVCKSGLTTDDCSVVNGCLGDPCSNDLLCKPNGNSYECVCRNGLPQTVQKRCIDCNRTLTEASGKLMSTNYPANYPDQSYCTWTIVSREANAIITLNITDFDVEGCPFDYLEVYDGNSSKSNMIGQYCEEVPKMIVSSGNALHVVFTSDDSVNLRGFIASYVAESRCRTKRCSHTCTVVSTSPRVETCVCPPWTRLNPRNDSQCLAINACNTTITNSSGYIVSPDYPQNYPANVTCSWNIPASPNTVISLSFSDMDMEGAGTNCPYDSLTVFRDSSVSSGTVLGKFCGSVTPQDMISSGAGGMFIVFQSDATLFGRGFKAQFSITNS